jgi:hypothetical protein
MTTEEMLKKLDKVENAREDAKQKELNDNIAFVAAQLHEAENLLPKVFELAPVVEKLIKLNYGIVDKDSIFAHSMFLTNRIHHNLGFAGWSTKFGYQAGGACGNHDLIAKRLADGTIHWAADPDDFGTDADTFARLYANDGYFVKFRAERIVRDIKIYIAAVEKGVQEIAA